MKLTTNASGGAATTVTYVPEGGSMIITARYAGTDALDDSQATVAIEEIAVNEDDEVGFLTQMTLPIVFSTGLIVVILALLLLRPKGEQRSRRRLRDMNEREKVEHYYQKMEKMLTKKVPRTMDRTPREYAREVEASLPINPEPVHGLTSKFEVAKYSHYDVEKEHVAEATSELHEIERDFYSLDEKK
jgi:hypothetical protein